MLKITVPGVELFDEVQGFLKSDDFNLELEHSLVSLSKWEEKWEKPFLAPVEKSDEEVLSYIECMILTPDFPPDIIQRLSQENAKAIQEYINSKMTATWFNEVKKPPPSRDILTAELIYYWMITAGVPFECQHWHLSKLFTLLKVINLKNEKPKKMSKADAAARQRELNAQRKAKYGTTG